MNIEQHTWKIVGIKPLIQGNPKVMWEDFLGDAEADAKREKAGLKKAPRGKKPFALPDTENFTRAKQMLYENEHGQFYHPAMAFWNALLPACHKRELAKGLKALEVVTLAVTIIEEEFLLYDPDTLNSRKPKLLTAKQWLVDRRRAVNSAGSKESGVVSIHPKWKKWGGLLTMEIDMDFVKRMDWLTELLNVAGHNYGVGVGRIRCQGVVNYKEKWGGLGMGKFTAELKMSS